MSEIHSSRWWYYSRGQSRSAHCWCRGARTSGNCKIFKMFRHSSCDIRWFVQIGILRNKSWQVTVRIVGIRICWVTELTKVPFCTHTLTVSSFKFHIENWRVFNSSNKIYLIKSKWACLVHMVIVHFARTKFSTIYRTKFRRWLIFDLKFESDLLISQKLLFQKIRMKLFL